MVDVRKMGCSHDPCMNISSFGVEGIKTPIFGKQHAEDGMINVCSKSCSYDL